MAQNSRNATNHICLCSIAPWLPEANPGSIFTEVSCNGRNPAIKRMASHPRKCPRRVQANGTVMPQRKEIKMEQILKKFTLEFFGTGKHKTLPEKFFEAENGFLLDVRSKEEAGSLFIKLDYHPNVECRNIPIDELPNRLDEIPHDVSIAVFCSGTARSAIAYLYLLSKGYSDVRIIVGGYSALTEALMPGKVFKTLQKNME